MLAYNNYKFTKRILHVFVTLNCGGAEKRTLELYRHIQRNNNIQFDFLTMDLRVHYFSSEVKKYGARVFQITHPRASIIRHIVELIILLHKNGPFDAVHVHTSFHAGIVLFVARCLGIKVRICHSRTTSSKDCRSILKKVQIMLGRLLIKLNATHMLAISVPAAHFLFGKSLDCIIVPNSIDLEPYRNLSSESRLRQELKIDNNILIVGHVGRFSHVKNHKFLIDIAQELLRKSPNFKLFLVGDGETRSEIETLVRSKNLMKHVYFLGLRDDVPELMNLFDVFVFPSFYEGLGGAVLEAQAAGTPCLVSDRVPPEADLGLGLVKFINLGNPIETWIEELFKALNLKNKVHRVDIFKAFERKGYTLDALSKMLLKIYKVDPK